MKKTKYVTTFSKNGYHVYGKTWIDTFLTHAASNDVIADIYVDFNIGVQSDKINFIDYNSAIPNHSLWLSQFQSIYGGAFYNKKMGMRFSYKSFVMMHALENNPDCYVIWLDGDCVFNPNQDHSSFACSILKNKCIAVQREHNGGDDHCESGIVVFDTNHPDCKTFLNQFKDNYKIENVIHMGSPFDGFIVYRSLNGIDYVDLNDGWGRGGIQSDPNETFLNPEIRKRFIHNIGITGKNKYVNWKQFADKDEFFKLIHRQSGNIKKTPEEIKSQRQKLLRMRTK
jgi:hypothetical protein